MSESVTLKSYFYEVLIPSSQKNTSSPIEDILHHVSISFMKKLALYKCFNPRTHTGCDAMSNFELSFKFRFQSTHPHGVRPSGNLSFVLIHGFQSTHPHGVRPLGSSIAFVIAVFQSTHPHGVRHRSCCYICSHHRCFNPRTHTGCDSRQTPPCWPWLSGFNPRTHTGCDLSPR